MQVNEFALIVAGGKGTRIKSALPKQFLEINGLPVLMHTIQAFVRYSTEINIILVLPADDFTTWDKLVQKHAFNVPVTLCEGGETRFQSVRNGLQLLPDKGIVAIHDGVRPLVSEDIIGASFRLASVHKAAVASVRLKESIRVVDQDTTRALDRSRYRLIQTPQSFTISAIKKAYQVKEDESLTDDASVAEKAGLSISLFEGSYTNIKITTPEDLLLAEALLSKKN